MYNEEKLSKINNIEIRFYKLLKNLKKSSPKMAQKLEEINLNTKFSYKYIFHFLFLFFSFFLKKKSAKYIFQGIMHNEIIDLFDPREVLILANKDEINYCKKNNYQFHWIGYIYHAVIYF